MAEALAPSVAGLAERLLVLRFGASLEVSADAGADEEVCSVAGADVAGADGSAVTRRLLRTGAVFWISSI